MSLFDLYKGEKKQTLSFAFLSFLWAFGASLGWKNADSLFLIHVGADALPIAYAAIAISMLFIASCLLYAMARIKIHRLLVGVLLLGALFYLVVFALVKWLTWGTPLWYLMRVGGWIFFALATTCFWTFVDQFYPLRDAKRLFSLFSSAIFAGIAATGVVMHKGMLSLPELLLATSALLTISACTALYLSSKAHPLPIQHAQPIVNVPIKELAFCILSSPYTLFLMSFNFLTYVSLSLAEYNYMLAFEEHCSRDETLTMGVQSLFGSCLTAVSAFNLLFGLFAYSRLAHRFGVGSMTLISPFILLGSYLLWPTQLLFLAPLLTFFVCEGTLYIIDDNTFTLLLGGVPTSLKPKIRVFIESFFEPIGTLLSAFLLSTIPFSKVMGAITAAILLIIGWILRKKFPSAVHAQSQTS